VGLYTSPHLVSPRERITVNEVPVSEDAFAEWTTLLKPHIERTGASFFEATTAIAFADFAARGVDVAVVEVGLGGRLDATNVITPLVSVVTKIALEHTDYLGTDLKGIAREKAGIAKRGVPFVTGEPDAELRTELVREAIRRGAAPVILADTTRDPTPDTRLGLRGLHQVANAWVAAAALKQIPRAAGLPDGLPLGEEIPASFADAYIPARFDVRGKWIFDVAHNPDGMQVLVNALRRHQAPRPLHALVGIRSDKDWRPMLALLAPVVDRLVLTMPPSIPMLQRWSVSDFDGLSDGRTAGRPPQIMPDFDEALREIQDGAATVLVTGSFHTVGDALSRLPGFAPVG